MRAMRFALLVSAAVVAATLTGIGQGAPSGVTAYQGARLITGTGAAIENATFIVERGRFTQVDEPTPSRCRLEL